MSSNPFEEPPATDLANILPPTGATKSLEDAIKYNNQTQGSFNDILRTPFLQDLTAGSQSDGSKSISVFEAVSEGLTHFTASQIIDVSIVRKLSSYAGTVGQLVPILPRGRLAEVLSGLVKNYADFANKKSTESKEFYSSFSATSQKISDTIDALDDDLDALRDEIDDLKTQYEIIKGDDVVKRLKARLGKYFSSSDDSDQSFIALLADIFLIAADELSRLLSGNTEGEDLITLMNHLKDLQKRLRDVRLLLTGLSSNLASVMRQSVAIMTMWFRISQNLVALSGTASPNDKFDANEASVIKLEWDNFKAQAEAFTRAVSDVNSTAVTTLFDRSTSIIRRAVTTSRSIRVSRSAGNTSDKQEKALEALTTDDNTQASLEAMTETSGEIVANFNKLLRVPFLDSLHVSESASSTADKEDEETRIDLEELTIGFLKRYQQLQADTVPVARDLYAYSRAQQQLIPLLDGSLSIDSYVQANLGLIEARRQKAEDVHRAHHEFQQDWNIAILVTERAISEQKENIKSLESTIEDLVKQHKKMTLLSVFSFIGAALFTAAAFFTGGLLFVFMGAAALGLVVTGSKFAAQAAEIKRAINGYEAALSSAKETLKNLEFVLPIMTEVRDKLQIVTNVWNDLANKLADLKAGTEVFQALAFIITAEEFEPLKNTAIANWKGVETKVLEYIAVVSDVNPSV